MVPILAAVILVVAASGAPQTPDGRQRTTVVFETAKGTIEVEVDGVRAPLTAANFLRYVDAGFYDGGTINRAVRPDNTIRHDVPIQVIQFQIDATRERETFAPIPLERTSVTGILHKDGVISMARGAPDSATSGWFICINDQPSLDFGGARNPDAQGFAAFGRVVSGMDVVRKIQGAPSSANRTTNTEAQRLTPPIKIIKAGRVK
jgi:peptidyl-prolyl cis-trans isomerase A (cyclophilin A)